jgi:hypothetical protein|tara:strand:+ start:153 stop:410 length:258 start_codon:yes stop_codon:yes gene_type:complete
MEALSKVFSLIQKEGTSETLIGIFSNPDEARREIDKIERRNIVFYIQERLVGSVRVPAYEIEVKYCLKGHKSEMIVTRNSVENLN